MSDPEKKEDPQELFGSEKWKEIVEAESLYFPGCIGRPDRLADERERATQQSSAPFYASSEEQVEYLARVYKDCLRCRHGRRDICDATYGFGCHRDNEDSVLNALSEIINATILIPGRCEYILEKDIIAYSGESRWRDYLCCPVELYRAHPDNRVLSVPATLSGGQNSNTLLEAIDLINFVKMRGWNSLAIVAFPAHLPRAFASAVTAARHLDWNGKIYAHCGAPLRWDERVTHSHGTGAITRAQAVREEQKRLDAYCQNGKPVPLLRARALLDYLNQRDLGDQLETKSQNLGQ